MDIYGRILERRMSRFDEGMKKIDALKDRLEEFRDFCGRKGYSIERTDSTMNGVVVDILNEKTGLSAEIDFSTVNDGVDIDYMENVFSKNESSNPRIQTGNVVRSEHLANPSMAKLCRRIDFVMDLISESRKTEDVEIPTPGDSKYDAVLVPEEDRNDAKTNTTDGFKRVLDDDSVDEMSDEEAVKAVEDGDFDQWKKDFARTHPRMAKRFLKIKD